MAGRLRHLAVAVAVRLARSDALLVAAVAIRTALVGQMRMAVAGAIFLSRLGLAGARWVMALHRLTLLSWLGYPQHEAILDG